MGLDQYVVREYDGDSRIIDSVINHIKEQIGLHLQPCDHFTGIRYHNGNMYFNVILPQRVSESADFMKLKSFEKLCTIRVEPNGLCRVAIFPQEKISKLWKI